MAAVAALPVVVNGLPGHITQQWVPSNGRCRPQWSPSHLLGFVLPILHFQMPLTGEGDTSKCIEQASIRCLAFPFIHYIFGPQPSVTIYL